MISSASDASRTPLPGWVTGEKVYLRALERQDIPDWHRWFKDPLATEGLLGANPQSLDDITAYFEMNQKTTDAIMFAVCNRSDDRYIGNVRLSSIDCIHRSAAYGIFIGHPGFRNGGYGSDALIQLFRHGFHNMGLNRIWSIVSSHNPASLKSSEKCGMTVEGIARRCLFKRGQFVDGVYYGILRADFDRLHGDPDYWMERDRALLSDARDSAANPSPRQGGDTG